MKSKIIIGVLLLVLCCCFSDKQSGGFMTAYAQFLQGNLAAKTEEAEMVIWDCGYRDATFSDFQYALFDMNGDSIPELHVRSDLGYDIFTYYNDELLLWHSTSPYRLPTDDRALLFTRSGGGPPHISYIYEVLDFWGNVQLAIEFLKGDLDMNDIYDDQDDYYFCDVKVTKEQWDALTEPYLSATSGNIEWIRLTDAFNRIQ